MKYILIPEKEHIVVTERGQLPNTPAVKIIEPTRLSDELMFAPEYDGPTPHITVHMNELFDRSFADPLLYKALRICRVMQSIPLRSKVLVALVSGLSAPFSVVPNQMESYRSAVQRVLRHFGISALQSDMCRQDDGTYFVRKYSMLKRADATPVDGPMSVMPEQEQKYRTEAAHGDDTSLSLGEMFSDKNPSFKNFWSDYMYKYEKGWNPDDEGQPSHHGVRLPTFKERLLDRGIAPEAVERNAHTWLKNISSDDARELAYDLYREYGLDKMKHQNAANIVFDTLYQHGRRAGARRIIESIGPENVGLKTIPKAVKFGDRTRAYFDSLSPEEAEEAALKARSHAFRNSATYEKYMRGYENRLRGLKNFVFSRDKDVAL